MANQQPQTVSIDGTEYNIADLSDKAKVLIDHLSDLDRKLGSIAFHMDQENLVANLAAAVRNERNAKLAESDWTQDADVPQSLKDKWAPYRQALRDVPQQPGFPTEVTWPVAPAWVPN